MSAYSLLKKLSKPDAALIIIPTVILRLYTPLTGVLLGWLLNTLPEMDGRLGSVIMSNEEMIRATGLSGSQIRISRNILKKAGILSEKQAGSDGIKYAVNPDALESVLKGTNRKRVPCIRSKWSRAFSMPTKSEQIGTEIEHE